MQTLLLALGMCLQHCCVRKRRVRDAGNSLVGDVVGCASLPFRVYYKYINMENVKMTQEELARLTERLSLTEWCEANPGKCLQVAPPPVFNGCLF